MATSGRNGNRRQPAANGVGDRADALTETLELHDELALAGLKTHFVDIGGGIPVTYTDHQNHWNRFWDTLDHALLGDRTPVTYLNYGYGQIVDNGRVLGPRLAYPHHQAPIGGAWLDAIPTTTEPGAAPSTIADRLHERALQLRCEPGRALLDGCGATIATVIHTKPHRDDWLIGLDMNSSNCRTQKSELLTDPVHLPRHPNPGPPCSGYLTGAYCSESDLITHRRLPFTQPPAQGDLIVFPNTAGYYMHFTESRSHQFPLPHNIHHTADGWTLDPIDQPTPTTGRHQAEAATS